jgi:peptidoglycan hydrolase-like amidase
VGLSQWGARELAEQGKSYRQILEYFYPASELRSLGEPEPRSARAEKAS